MGDFKFWDSPVKGRNWGMPRPNQHRGEMARSDRQMPDEKTREFLRSQAIAHVGTTDAGWPYVTADSRS